MITLRTPTNLSPAVAPWARDITSSIESAQELSNSVEKTLIAGNSQLDATKRYGAIATNNFYSAVSSKIDKFNAYFYAAFEEMQSSATYDTGMSDVEQSYTADGTYDIPVLNFDIGTADYAFFRMATPIFSYLVKYTAVAGSTHITVDASLLINGNVYPNWNTAYDTSPGANGIYIYLANWAYKEAPFSGSLNLALRIKLTRQTGTGTYPAPVLIKPLWTDYAHFMADGWLMRS